MLENNENGLKEYERIKRANDVFYKFYPDPIIGEYNEKYNKLLSDFIKNLEEIKKLKEELSSSENDNELQKELQDKQDISEELRNELELQHLLNRLHPKAESILKESNNEVLLKFFKKESIEMTVMSLDIRKSTELMLKSKTPDNYAEFISELTERLKNIVINSFGVLDKFTGDGILAYFPTFYSGADGIYNCCLAAQECHDFFESYYSSNYGKFTVVIDTGLGIGIDHGEVKIVKINNELTIVGPSVVYACRLAGAPAKNTYLNITAYNKISKYEIKSKKIKFDIKNEGKIIVYELEDIINKEVLIPDWVNGKI